MDLAVVVRAILALLSGAIVAVTLLPFSRSKAWWVRMWDFPRAQIAGLALLVLIAMAALSGPERWVALPLLVACLFYQAWRIRPYSPLVRPELEFPPEADPARDIRILAANVKMENREYARMRDLIEAVDPDILLLMEPDAGWAEAMEPTLRRYPVVVRQPQDNHYGLLFATRLAARDARAVDITPDETPALYAELEARDGEIFRFVGLHPRPPVPGEDTEERDAETLYAARFAARTGVPLVAVGDFNDVAWSDTSQRFKHVGRYLDPRIGRGLFPSFPVGQPLFRCPIDQLYVTENVTMVEFGRGPDVGSDHFPLIASVRIDAELARRLNRAPRELTGSEDSEIDARVEAHRRRLGPRAF
jgi:endonuclease/exonuclease/phosphatase (EEP) superfamily protein YafD